MRGGAQLREMEANERERLDEGNCTVDVSRNCYVTNVVCWLGRILLRLPVLLHKIHLISAQKLYLENLEIMSRPIVQ